MLFLFNLINFSLCENSSKSNDDELIDISSGYSHINPSDRTYIYISIILTKLFPLPFLSRRLINKRI